MIKLNRELNTYQLKADTLNHAQNSAKLASIFMGRASLLWDGLRPTVFVLELHLELVSI